MGNYIWMLGFTIALTTIFKSAESNFIPFENRHPPFEQQISRGSVKDISHYGFKGIDRVMPKSIEISDCIFTTFQTGIFTYKAATDNTSVCGVYLMADADKTIELVFLSFNVPCSGDGLVSFVDGWELNGELFPPLIDHSLPHRKRFTEFCGTLNKRTFKSSQNAALIQHRIPFRGEGFTIIVRHRKNRNPCNVLVHTTGDSISLRNYGKRINCTLVAIYPSALRVTTLNVGGRKLGSSSRQMETGTVHDCDKRGLQDQVQIGGGSGLDTSKGEVFESICGVDTKPGGKQKIIGCEVTIVRLISSGLFDNSLSVILQPTTEEDIVNTNFMCGL